MHIRATFFGQRTAILRVVLPVSLTLLLFVWTIFFFTLPVLKDALLLSKKEMIRELTALTWELMADYERRVRSGELSREDAMRRASARIRVMRYGAERQDYFWINDMRPTMIMHPYLPELEGQDVSTLADSRGVYPFVEFVRVVREQGEGYVQYLWQWKDKPQWIVPKLSYVKGFPPWNWIVGTGLYLDDIYVKIDTLTLRLNLIFMGILLLIGSVSAFMLIQGFQMEKRRKLAELMMIESEKMLLIGGLTAGTAHEINNPLGIIQQGAQNIQRRLSLELDKNRQVAKECDIDLAQMRAYLEQRNIFDYLAGIQEASLRASSIVTSMLNFSRPDKQKMEAHKLEQLLEDAIEFVIHDYDLKKRYDVRHIRIVRDFAENLPRVSCLATEIEQVFLNLLRNAAQAVATTVHDGAYTPQITIRTRQEAHYALVSIEDNGPGMDAKTLENIFKPFFTTKAPGEGTGLGLSVSHFIITNHHRGNISVESIPGRGTIFHVRLLLKR